MGGRPARGGVRVGRLLIGWAARGPSSASGTDTSPLAHGRPYIQGGAFRRKNDVLGKISPVLPCSLPRVLRAVIPHCHSLDGEQGKCSSFRAHFLASWKISLFSLFYPSSLVPSSQNRGYKVSLEYLHDCFSYFPKQTFLAYSSLTKRVLAE